LSRRRSYSDEELSNLLKEIYEAIERLDRLGEELRCL
jgi:hypothetical protein